jgi:hypothetical protein
MSPAQSLYERIGASIDGAQAGQLFGKPCFKAGGKAFISFFQESMVFKLDGAVLREALALDGARNFDPSGKRRPMKAWVQLPADQQAHWARLAQCAFDFLASGTA